MRKHKYRAIATKTDGMRFDSKLEAQYYNRLKILKSAGEIAFFLRQVPLHLPGNIKYLIDFVEFWDNGDIKWVDVKGVETSEFIMKKKMVEDLYPIKIDVVKKDRL